MSEIKYIKDITNLVVSGETNWNQHGNVKVVEKDGLYLFSYTKDAMYANSWNFFERVSRGLIISASGEIVARPFTKFFNWGQVCSDNGDLAYPKRGTHLVNVFEKVDGSLGILYRNNGYKIATRGSFESEQAIWATEFLNKYYNLSGLDDSLTLLFEIIYPENRIVVNYNEREDLVLLGAINRFTGEELDFYPNLYVLANQFGFTLPKVYNFNNVTEIIEKAGRIKGDEEEGFVLRYSDNSRFKIKGDEYLELHKLLSGLSRNNVFEAWQRGVKYDAPDEFKNEVESWLNEFETNYRTLLSEFESAFNSARKEFALFMSKFPKPIQTLAFLKLDGIDIEDQLRRYCKE